MNLVVKNFGTISDLSIELKPLLLFFGQQEASIVAKLIGIFREGLATKTDFLGALKHFNIDYLLNENAFIEYNYESYYYKYENGIFTTNPSENLVQEVAKSSNLMEVFERIGTKQNRVIYIPVEREVYIPQNVYETLENDMNFPKHVLFFWSRYEKARKKLKTTHFDFLAIEPRLLKLSQCSTAIQVAVPLAFVVEKFSKNGDTLFIIEQVELHLLPSTQQLLVDFLIENCLVSNNQLIITTISSNMLAYFSDWIAKNKDRVGEYSF